MIIINISYIENQPKDTPQTMRMESCCDPKKRDKRAKSARPFSYEMLGMGPKDLFTSCSVYRI